MSISDKHICEVSRSQSLRDCFGLLSQRFAMPRNDILWGLSGSPAPPLPDSPILQLPRSTSPRLSGSPVLLT